MLDKETVKKYKSELDEINRKINRLSNQEIKILEKIRKQLLEMIVENQNLFEALGEPKYSEDDISNIQNGAQFDIDAQKRAIFNRNENKLNWPTWKKTIMDVIKDNKEFKEKVSKKNNQ